VNKWISLQPTNEEAPRVPISTFECYVVGLSGLLIFFAWDLSFNMQVLLPVVLLLLVTYFFNSQYLDAKTLFLCFGILSCSAISSLISICVDPKIVDLRSLIRMLYFAEILAFYAVIVYRRYSREHLQIIIACNILAGTVIALGSIAGLLGGTSGKIVPLNIWGIKLAPNTTAALLAVDLILGVLALRFTESSLKRVLFLMASAIIGFGVIIAGSRAAHLAVAIGLSIVFIQFIASAKIGVPIKVFVISVIIGFANLIIFNLEAVLPDFLYNRFSNPNYDDTSNQIRLMLWIDGLQSFIERPLFGYGIGNYNYYIVHESGFSQHTVVVAHNTYLDSLLDIGIVGTALVAILLIRGMKGVVSSKTLLPYLCTLVFVSAILGSERAYYFWNGIMILSICSYYTIVNNKKNALEDIFNFNNNKQSRYSPVPSRLFMISRKKQ
jgi:O-antigen ligase